MMEFEWHESKRKANLAKHGIDFKDAVAIWLGDVIDPIASRADEAEVRLLALGIIGADEVTIAAVYTVRSKIRRIISARRARRNERKAYKNVFGKGQ